MFLYEEFEDTRGVIRSRKSKKNRQRNGQKDKQRSTKHTHKTKDRVTRTSLNTGGELGCSVRGRSSRSSSGSRRVNLVTNPVLSHEWGGERECLRQVEHIRRHLWHIYYIAVNQVMVATVKPFIYLLIYVFITSWYLQQQQVIVYFCCNADLFRFLVACKVKYYNILSYLFIRKKEWKGDSAWRKRNNRWIINWVILMREKIFVANGMIV